MSIKNEKGDMEGAMLRDEATLFDWGSEAGSVTGW